MLRKSSTIFSLKYIPYSLLYSLVPQADIILYYIFLLNIIILIVIKVTFTLNKYPKKFHFLCKNCRPCSFFCLMQRSRWLCRRGALLLSDGHMCHWTRKYFGVTRADAPLIITSHHNHAADIQLHSWFSAICMCVLLVETLNNAYDCGALLPSCTWSLHASEFCSLHSFILFCRTEISSSWCTVYKNINSWVNVI